MFESQSNKYQSKIIGSAAINIAIVAGVRQGWDRFIGNDGIFIGMNSFGGSAPADQLYKHFGITAEAAVKAAMARLK